MHRRRFPEVPGQRWTVIPNGYDEDNFAAAEQHPSASTHSETITLVHAGILYPGERDPRAFFAGVAQLKKTGLLARYNLRIVLRATCYDEVYAPLLREHGIDDVVSLQPSVSYREALREMLDADGLIVFQGSSCNHQIPAKLYEYMRAGRPILGLTTHEGDTAKTLRDCGCNHIAALDDAEQIKSVLERFLGEISAGSATGVPLAVAEKYSRKAGSRELATIFDEITTARATPARSA
jgi:glycosyltransferase involved in cell wall biosynthesis